MMASLSYRQVIQLGQKVRAEFDRASPRPITCPCCRKGKPRPQLHAGGQVLLRCDRCQQSAKEGKDVAEAIHNWNQGIRE